MEKQTTVTMPIERYEQLLIIEKAMSKRNGVVVREYDHNASHRTSTYYYTTNKKMATAFNEALSRAEGNEKKTVAMLEALLDEIEKSSHHRVKSNSLSGRVMRAIETIGRMRNPVDISKKDEQSSASESVWKWQMPVIKRKN